MKKYLIICLLLFLQNSICLSQKNLKALTPEINENIIWFDSIIGLENSGIVNAKIDYYIYVRSYGHRFFINDDWQTGLVHYDEQTYSVSGIKYDVVQQNIIIKYINESNLTVPLQLHPEKIKWFNISDSHFENIGYNDSVNSVIESGFYNVLYTGNHLHLISKRKKDFIERFKTGTREHDFISKDKYFVLQEGKAINIRRKKDFYILNPENKQEIKHYIRKNNLKISINNDEDLIQLIEFCDSLIQQVVSNISQTSLD